MDYNLKIKIDDMELFESEDASVKTPFITNVQLKSSTSMESMAIGSTASDALYFTLMNPYKQSFDGEKVEFYISPQADTSTTGLGEIEAQVGDSTTDQVIDTNDVIGFADNTEEGEPLTPEEEAEAEAQEIANTESTYTFFSGEEETIVDVTTDEEAEPEWVKMGTFYVFQQSASVKDNSIRFECLDGFSKLNAIFTPTTKRANLQTIYNDFRVQCFQNFDIEVDAFEFPDEANVNVYWDLGVSFRDSIGYLAGAVGGFATFGFDDTLGISFYSFNDTILLDDVVIKFEETSAGEMLVEGVQCDRSINPYKDDIIEIGASANISFFNPFVNEDMLQAIYDYYVGTKFVGGELSILWNENIQSGQFIRIMSPEEYANYVALNNALNAETSASEILELKSRINTLGTVVLVSNQTIDFTGEARSVITSVCNTEYAKNNKVKSPNDQVVRNLYAEMVAAEYIDATKVVTEGLQAQTAEIKQAIVDNIEVNSINGNVIKNSHVLAKALSDEAIETVTGSHVFYGTDDNPPVNPKIGDLWYKTVTVGEEPILFEYQDTGWVNVDFDFKTLRANSITAQEINTNDLATNSAFIGTLESNLARIGDSNGQHVNIDNDSVDIKNGEKTFASYGEVTTIGDPNTHHVQIAPNSIDIGYENLQTFHAAGGIRINDETITEYGFIIGTVEGYTLTPSERIIEIVSITDGNNNPITNYSILTDGSAIVVPTIPAMPCRVVYMGYGGLVTITSEHVEIDGDTTFNGGINVNGGITVNGHSSPVGTILTNSKTNIKVVAGIDTHHNGASLTLPRGVWVIVGRWMFNTRASGNTSSNRQTTIAVNGTNVNYQRINTYSYAYGILQAVHILNVTDDSATVINRGSCSLATQSNGLDSSNIWAVRIA